MKNRRKEARRRNSLDEREKVSTNRRRLAVLFRRLVPGCCLAVCLLGPMARGANTFANAGPMATGRQHSTATLLPDGKVLVAGGYNNGVYLTSAEVYDPATGGWKATGSLGTARSAHIATLLANGKVLVAGGY